jgi:hypothetical protein
MSDLICDATDLNKFSYRRVGASFKVQSAYALSGQPMTLGKYADGQPRSNTTVHRCSGLLAKARIARTATTEARVAIFEGQYPIERAKQFRAADDRSESTRHHFSGVC